MSIYISSTHRTLPIRRRSDLVARRQIYHGQHYWAIKDPVSLQYFRFHEEEYAILQMLDGTASIESIKREFERRFRPQTISFREIDQLLATLFQNGLVIADVAGQGGSLRELGATKRRRERTAALTNVLAIRFRGFDPDRLLNVLSRGVGWLFTKTAACASLLLMIAATLLILVQWEAFRGRLPEFHEFFAMKNWLWLAATLAVTKVLHEFGHGLACKRMGGECHEMGVMLLVLTPCLYCNVSDSWMLPSKWQRAAVGAAGMYVELLLASLATFIWWFTHPGMLHYLCLNVMFVSSVSTVLFNANPLLRYDGYYILTDIAEIPNLRQKATQVLSRFAKKWLLGIDEPPDPFAPQRGLIFFACYSVAAFVYRWVVMISILWFLLHVFEPYGLKPLGVMIAVFTIGTTLVMPLVQFIRFLQTPGRMQEVNTTRWVTACGLGGVLLAAVAYVPVPHRVWCTLTVEPKGAVPVYVDVPGMLHTISHRPGDRVEAGTAIAEFENLDLHLTVAQLQAERSLLAVRLASLRQQAFTNDEAALSMAEVEKSLEALDEQLVQRRKDLAQLTVSAPARGTILPPPRREPPKNLGGRLPQWSGLPLAETNLGTQLDSGVLLCQVGDPRTLQAQLHIDQTDVEYVRTGQVVEFKLDGWPDRTFTGEISEVARRNHPAAGEETRPRSSDGSSGATGGNTRHDTAATPTIYHASVPFTDETGLTLLRTHGTAKIHAGYRPLGHSIWRYLCRTFRFEL